MRRGALLGTSLLFTLIFSLWGQPKTPEANWVWFDEGDPLAGAPSETHYFRRVFTLDKLPKKASLDITADNGFTAWINGAKVGEGDAWQQMYRFDVRKHLKAGKNILAVEGRNEGGPAGLVARISSLVVTDKNWKASRSAAEGWRGADFDDKGWKSVKVLGPYGKTGPWGDGGGVVGPAKPRTFTVPEGFKVELAVKRPDDRGPFSIVNMCFDAKGRLLLSQEGGSTLLCVKPDKDGVYQEVVEYCTQVRGNHGMCWVGDALLLVGDGPKGTGLYRCKDTKNNDRVDEVTLLHKFHGGMGEHGPHAIIHGPDGWLYVVVGNHAHAQVDQLADNSPLRRWPKGMQGPDQGKPGTTEDVLLPRLDDANGHAAGLRAPGGTIWRMDHEGKNLSLYSAGYRNHFDAAFSPSGELFSYDSDMEWDENLPWYRAVRVTHSTPGSDFVWRTGAANTPNYYLDSLPPLFETGRGSPVGVEVCDHSAFPAKYRGMPFVCDWSVGIIYAIHLKKHRASYIASAEKFCTGSPLNVTDCAFGPDGALYITLGGRGSQGGVYRIASTKGSDKKFVIINPRPGDVEAEQLLRVDQPLSAWGRVRIQQILAKSKAKSSEITSALVKRANKGTGDAVILLHLCGMPPSLELLNDLVDRRRATTLAAQAVWSIGVQGLKEGQKTLIKALGDRDALVRRRTCEALVRGRIELPIEHLGPVLDDDDIFVRTAARLVLERMDPKKWAERVWKSESKRILREGIVALCKTGKAADYTEPIFERLHEGAPGDRVQDLLDHLRTVQLALVHTTKRLGSVRGLALDCLEMFPHKDASVSRELAILITQFRREKILDEPVHAKLLNALVKEKDQPQAIHYFYCLRFLHDGWTKEQKASLLTWFDATRTWKGGASFNGFLQNILRDFGPVFTKKDRIAVLSKAGHLRHSALALLRTAPENQLADPEMQTILRTLVEGEPALRDLALTALARNLNAETWPLVVRGLELTSQQVIFDTIQALKRSPIKPKSEDAKPYRALLLSSARLAPGNRGQAVELLRHWAGEKRFSADDKDWKGELAGWSKWFSQTFPKEPSLPDVLSDKPSESKWKFSELLTYLEGEGKTGDVKKGRVVFEKGSCLKCHRYGKEGEGLGPDLTTLSKRFKRTDTLEAMFYPSKIISDQYRSTTLVTMKGQQITGLMAIQGDTVTVLQNDGVKVMLKTSDIDQKLTSLVSVMPDRLLDQLTKEEIRDLFAFMELEPSK